MTSIKTLLTLTIALLAVPTAYADFTFFDWTPINANTGTGAALEYTATYNLQPQVTFRRANGATDPNFLATYGSGEIPRFLLADNGSKSGGFTFSAPLRSGSIMILFDLDVSESISFSSNSPITYLGQIETRVGQNSVPPNWNSVTQTLQGPSAMNLEPAAIFDVSGVTNISINYANPFGTEATLAFAVNTIPEPNGLLILYSILLPMVTLRRRQCD